MTPTTVPISPPPRLCPECGYKILPDDTRCPQCDAELLFEDVSTAVQTPLMLKSGQTNPRLSLENNVLLQFLPSGTCVSHPLKTILILGRALGPAPSEVLDLTVYDGHELGVSRRHCILRRLNNQLIVSDLDSANGTFLNDERLKPREEYPVNHGDTLVLGKLEIRVYFSPG